MDASNALLQIAKESQAALKKTDDLVDVAAAMLKRETDTPEREEYLRVSRLYYYCPREVFYRHLVPLPPSQEVKINLGMKLRMATGTFLHSYFQEEVFGPAGILKGKWTRLYIKDGRAFRQTYEGFNPWTFAAPDTDLDYLGPWHYIEYVVTDEENKIKGHVDGLLCLNRIKAFLETKEPVPGDAKIEENLRHWELKSCDDRKFREVREDEWHSSEESYRWQASTYQRLLGMEYTLVLYVDRKYFGLHSFIYKGEPNMSNRARSLAECVWGAIAKKEIPPRCADCMGRKSKQAKECPYMTVCFSDNPMRIVELAEEKCKHGA